MNLSDKEFLKVINGLNNPFKLQDFILSLSYNAGERLSVHDVAEFRKGDCLEAAVFAVLVLKHHGYDAFLVDLEAVRDEDHVLAVYRLNGKYGSIAQSKFMNLRQRMPVYFSIKELVMSYFNSYFNFFGELSLRKYSEAFRIDGFFKRFSLEDVNLIMEIEKQLLKIPHKDLGLNVNLPRVSKEKFWSELEKLPDNVRVGKRYIGKI
ncbi:MAG: hypothetical protein ABH828_00560 [archaeon]